MSMINGLMLHFHAHKFVMLPLNDPFTIGCLMISITRMGYKDIKTEINTENETIKISVLETKEES